LFAGNPAAVCPLTSWPEDRLLQSIAAENNLSETAFFVREGDGFRLRWFTPVSEVGLCGHATLAAAHTLCHHLGYEGNEIRFETQSGGLTVHRVDAGFCMDFPARPLRPVEHIPEALLRSLGKMPLQVFQADDYMAVFSSEKEIADFQPDLNALFDVGLRGLIVSAPGTSCDFVSRFFAPKLGIPEDPVTGSAHCELAPYWAARLGRNQLRAIQLSARGGEVGCEVKGTRVHLTGRSVTYLQGEIVIPE